MPRYPARSPLSYVPLRQIAGGAVFAVMAEALGGVWGASELETAFLRKRDNPAWHERGGVPPSVDPTNQFARMLEGQLPLAATLVAFEDVLDLPRGTLGGWIDGRLWPLLGERVTDEAIAQALESVRGRSRGLLFEEGMDPVPGRTALRNTFAYGPSHLREFTSKPGTDELLALTAITVEARRSRAHRETEMAGAACRDIFPTVVAQHPELYFRWRHLAAVYWHRVWSPMPTDYRVLLWGKKLRGIEKDMAKAAQKARIRGVRLCPETEVATPEGWSAMCLGKPAARG